MSTLSDIGNLMYLYLDDIDPGKGTNAPEFLIMAAANILNANEGRNWVPVIVKNTGEDQYEVIGNYFIYAVAEAAGLERVWCIIADSSQETTDITEILAREAIPKINLSTASRDEIKAALQYVIEQPGSLLKSVKLLVATNRIEEAPRQYWETLEPVTKLKCGITKGKKLDVLKQIFYLTPQPMPDDISDPNVLNTLTSKELKKLAKKRGIKGYSKLTKSALVKLLS